MIIAMPGSPVLTAAYLITSLMRDVIRRGTGAAAMVLKRNDLAGKTGSTNDHRDAWFTGFDSCLSHYLADARRDSPRHRCRRDGPETQRSRRQDGFDQ